MTAIKVEETVEIDRSADEVFTFVSNPENLATWSGVVVEVRRDGGDRFTLIQKFLGRRFETPCEVTASEPNQRYVYRSTGGPIPYTFSFALEPSGPGTRLTYTGEGEPGSFFSLVGPLSREPRSGRCVTISKRSKTCSSRPPERGPSHGTDFHGDVARGATAGDRLAPAGPPGHRPAMMCTVRLVRGDCRRRLPGATRSRGPWNGHQTRCATPSVLLPVIVPPCDARARECGPRLRGPGLC